MSSLGRQAPALAVSAAALFFAVGGSAFALGNHGSTASANQKTCATGSVKGIVGISGDSAVGFQKGYVSGRPITTRWGCRSGLRIEARRVDRGVYDVRIAGLRGTPIVTPLGEPVKVGTKILADGGVEVRMLGTVNGAETEVDEPFVVVFV